MRRLIDDIGFDAVNAGNLDESWRQGTGAPAYCTTWAQLLCAAR